MGFTPTITTAQKRAIVEMASERVDGKWKYSYFEIAKKVGITRSYVSKVCLKSNVLPRQPYQRKGQFAVPDEFLELAMIVRRKIGNDKEATRIIREHVEKRVRAA